MAHTMFALADELRFDVIVSNLYRVIRLFLYFRWCLIFELKP